MDTVTYERVAHQDDPRRCQRGTPLGPCPYVAVENGTFCPVHGGAAQLKANAAASKRSYLAAQWAAQTGVFANDPQIKSLREEIGIARLLLQKTMERCKTDNDLLMRSSTIFEMLAKIEKLILSCNQLDMKLGVMLDKVQLQDFAGKVIELVSAYITDPDVLDSFSKSLVQAVIQAGKPDTKAKDVLERATLAPN